ncbi:hypothetical protein MKJ01_00820 [Chryseobacterium sp. SSA4.19]|uniref:hypothetical protein n=1 Tax=Chryseobacterium sp. SSA4.19 TaxID=2919915 RepID=UPI001F4E21D6|nr:hypothetical protein [Chryseobacterium sp. SSA4.19]MCJ8152299.1 hypothetical protein [Chryseobacterium sp. SSA4.19]
MEEKLYFIKVNPVAAKINLYNKLCREEDQVLKFLEEDKKTSLELIRKKVHENIESLSQDELLSIFNWFDSKYSSDKEEMKIQLFIHGIDLFYKITSSANIQQLQQILSDYEQHGKLNSSHVIDSENFNNFLIYGIFFTALMDKKTEEDYILADLKYQHTDLYSFAEDQCRTKNSEQPVYNDTYEYFKKLFDCTKFYKGSIIKLEHKI